MAEHSRLEPFLLLARSTKGAAAAKVVLDATAATGVYTFSELMEVPNVRELMSDPAFEKQARLLNLFAYGTYQDYSNAPETFPPLTPAHNAKLRHLTLVSLALRQRALAYAEISQALQVTSTRELENLIIDAIYAGLLGGKMHQQEQTLHIDWVTGRDVRPEQIADVKLRLETWCQNASTILAALDDQIAVVRKEALAEAERDAEYQSTLDKAFLAARKEVEAKDRKARGAQNLDEAIGDAGTRGNVEEEADWQHAIAASLNATAIQQSSQGISHDRRGSRGTDARSIESIDEPRKKRAKD